MEPTLDEYKLSCELIGHSMDVRSVAAGGMDTGGEGQIIVSGSRDKTVKIWKSQGSLYIESLTLKDQTNFISCVYYLKSEKWICTGSNDTSICIYEEGGFVPALKLTGHESTVCSIAAGVVPMSIISGSWDKTARIWTIDSNKQFTSVVLRGHEAAVWAVASMPEVKKFITGSADKAIYYWNVKGEKLRFLKGHTDCVRSIATFSDNSLVSASNDATIRFWNEDGECMHELSGHSNYIYALAKNEALGNKVVLSSGEDSSIRMWDLVKGKELGSPIIHPAQSVWSIACLNNGDIVTGSSDGIVRIFTKDPSRFARPEVLRNFETAVQSRKAQMSEEIGGYKKADLPGPEGLLSKGTQEGQTKMIRHQDGSVKCYMWELGQWKLVGDVTGASGGSQSTSGKVLYEGKEYDYVFTVDISDTMPPIKLPYNKDEDPWHAAQAFIHRNSLPQVYLDQVANFIIKNSNASSQNATATPVTNSFHDPFTGESRYVPGSGNSNFQTVGNVDPFTGGSSYSTGTDSQPQVDVNFVKGSDKHFPVSQYKSLDVCDPKKVLEKIKQFNSSLPNVDDKVSETVLDSIIEMANPNPAIDPAILDFFHRLLLWPKDKLFPLIDILRLAIRDEDIYILLRSKNFIDLILPHINHNAGNQLMTVRCLSNMMLHPSGREDIQKMLPKLIDNINDIKTGSANMQNAIASFYLNVTIIQILGLANRDICRLVTEGLIEFLKWANDLEALYRSMQAIGNLTTTPYGQDISALIISVDEIINKIRKLTNTPQNPEFSKINSIGKQLLASF